MDFASMVSAEGMPSASNINGLNCQTAAKPHIEPQRVARRGTRHPGIALGAKKNGRIGDCGCYYRRYSAEWLQCVPYSDPWD